MTIGAQRWLSAILLTFLLVSPTNGLAQIDPERPGLDLLVMVDRSASMSGHGRGARSDPYQVPDLIAGRALELMARHGGPNRVDHRLGVMSFGSLARIDLPFSRIRRDNVEHLRGMLEAVPSRASLGNTDVLAAFAAAAKMFHRLPAHPARKRAILLVTDGVPFVPGREMGDYGGELRRFVAANLPPPLTTIDVVLLPPAQRGGIRHHPLWRDLSGDRVHQLSGDRHQNLQTLFRVVTGLLGTRTAESQPAGAGQTMETLVLPPYLDLVVFDIFRGPQEVEVAVFAPDALRPLTAAAEGVEEIRLGDVLSTVVVRRPVPGLWTFRKAHPDARVKVLSQQFFPRGVLIDPKTAQAPRQFDPPGTLAYRIIDGNGHPLQELPRYPLSLELSLVKPDGIRKELRMSHQPERGAMVFQSQEKIEFGLSGRYWTEVLIATRDVNAQRVNVFQDLWSGFSVAAASPIDCRVMAPELGEAGFLARRLLWTRPVATSLQCVGPEAQPVDMKSIVTGPLNDLFQADLRHEGQRRTADLDLHYLGSGAFRGWLHGTGSPGSYRLELKVDRSRLVHPYNIRFLPSATSFVYQLSWVDWMAILLLAIALPAGLRWLARVVWKRRWVLSSKLDGRGPKGGSESSCWS
jgi:hypothetical protein